MSASYYLGVVWIIALTLLAAQSIQRLLINFSNRSTDASPQYCQVLWSKTLAPNARLQDLLFTVFHLLFLFSQLDRTITNLELVLTKNPRGKVPAVWEFCPVMVLQVSRDPLFLQMLSINRMFLFHVY